VSSILSGRSGCISSLAPLRYIKNALHFSSAWVTSMREIYLLRHGTTQLTGKYVGVMDIPLSAEGRKEIFAQRSFISQHRFSTIFCSPLTRCRQTFGELRLAQDVIYDDRITEIDFGNWEGKSFAEISRTAPALIEEWCRGENSFRFPEGDRLEDFHGRIDAFADLLHVQEKGKILIISHGGVIRYLICRLLNLPFDNCLYFRVDCGKFTTIELYSNGGVLTGLNRGN